MTGHRFGKQINLDPMEDTIDWLLNNHSQTSFHCPPEVTCIFDFMVVILLPFISFLQHIYLSISNILVSFACHEILINCIALYVFFCVVVLSLYSSFIWVHVAMAHSCPLLSDIPSS